MPPAFLRDLKRCTGQRKHRLRSPVTHIGRDREKNHIVIPADTVSGEHASIEFIMGVFGKGDFFLEDRMSTNGTFKNGRRFSDPDKVKKVRLRNGDRIKFDIYEFKFTIEKVKKKQSTKDQIAKPYKSPGQPPVDPEPPLPEPTIPPSGYQDDAVISRALSLYRTNHEEAIDFCKLHEHEEATEICPRCKIRWCSSCIRVVGGVPMCVECAKQAQEKA